ncbi:MAG: glycosyltransferase [Spirochaetota bacterium]|nr:MAG: glycosyltransferase [Spirochaetota bacterium]
MNKKVSIIIPAYNEENYLHRTLESVASQTFNHELIEVIVVDNASTDSTASVFHTFFKNCSIQNMLIEEPVLSSGRAKNAGASKARGEVLLFIDADSRIDPRLVQEVYNWYMRGYLMGIIRIKPDSIDPMANLYFDVIHFGKKLIHIAANMGFCQRKLFVELAGFNPDLQHAEDLEFFTRAKKMLKEIGKQWCIIEDAPISTSTRRMDRLPFKLGYPLTLFEWAFGGFLGLQRKKYEAYR